MSTDDKPVRQPANPSKRAPTAFSLQSEQSSSHRKPQAFDQGFSVIPDEQDVFLGSPELEAASLLEARPRKRRFSFGKLAFTGIGAFLSLAFWLWADQVIRDLFNRSDWLGYVATALLTTTALALIVVVSREVIGLMRLGAIQHLKTEAEAILPKTPAKQARSLVTRLESLLSHRPETAKGRAALNATKDEIIDAPQLMELAERELLTPLDSRARILILAAAKRTSVVTAISPRAVVDLAYVLFEVARLVRAMAELYGGRPGTIGLIRLLRDVIAHLAVTGSIAVGDGIAQQVLGHGIAARLSTRLGEGVINGLLTARIGIAAMDLCRPLPFRALKRPGVSDFMSDIMTTAKAPD